MKRDDLTGLGMGGNKLRKLEYFIHDAMEKGATMLVTTGGSQTNHGRQTAAVAAKYGLKCAIVTDDPYPCEITGNVLLDRIFGSDVIFAPGKPAKESIKETIAKYEAEGEKVYYVPMGGSNELGCAGYIECAKELIAQCRDLKNPHVYVTAGSLGTYMGLLLGLQDTDIELTGILIAPYDEDVREFALSYYRRCCSYYDIPEKYKVPEDFHILDYTYGDYNNPVPEVRDAIRYMGQMEGLVLDPAYTGKTFSGILDLIKRGEISSDETVVMVHTGGMPGLYAGKHLMPFSEELSEGIFIL